MTADFTRLGFVPVLQGQALAGTAKGRGNVPPKDYTATSDMDCTSMWTVGTTAYGTRLYGTLSKVIFGAAVPFSWPPRWICMERMGHRNPGLETLGAKCIPCRIDDSFFLYYPVGEGA